MYQRFIEKDFRNNLHQGKTIFLYGPRQVGKTTFVKYILSEYSLGTGVYYSSDFRDEISRLLSRERRIYDQYLKGVRLLIIDEAQNIPDIGNILKALHDGYPDCQVIATGSSSFDLAQRSQEAMTGRHIVFYLLPFSLQELHPGQNYPEYLRMLSSYLLYGMYPGVITARNHQQQGEYLYQLSQSYLFKDILQFEGIKKADTIIKLCKMLAYQIGKPVSYAELANKLQLSKQTVERYCDILQQAFIVFELGSFSKNPRKELSKGKKFYFRDLGMRNALLGSYQDMDIRYDKGELRENFVISEYMKKKLYSRTISNQYFWRSYDEQELDLLIENGGNITGFEIKRKDHKAWKTPSGFVRLYPDIPTSLLDHENLLQRIASQ